MNKIKGMSWMTVQSRFKRGSTGSYGRHRARPFGGEKSRFNGLDVRKGSVSPRTRKQGNMSVFQMKPDR